VQIFKYQKTGQGGAGIAGTSRERGRDKNREGNGENRTGHPKTPKNCIYRHGRATIPVSGKHPKVPKAPVSAAYSLFTIKPGLLPGFIVN